MGFLYSLSYMTFLGILCFPFGRFLAKIPLSSARFPFRICSFEQEGKLYEKLGIRFWQNKAPDISKLIPGIVPRKELVRRPNAQMLQSMINETCVAELTHVLLCLAGLGILKIWPGVGGVILYLAYLALGNIPFILIQRYNRPRLIRLLRAAEGRERSQIESSDPQQQ